MDEEINQEEQELSVYNDKAREELSEADEIDSDEAGFMKGYESEADAAFCDTCKKILTRDHIEKEINTEVYTFCSEECAEDFEKKKE
jgi:hypothetical protein